MATVTAYSASNLIVLFDGTPVTAFADGDDAITLTPFADQVTELVGINGDTTLNVSNNRTTQAALKLMHWSKQNAIFTASFEALRQTGVVVPIPFIVKDLSGNNVVTSDFAVIKSPPESQYGFQAGVLTWNLILVNAEHALLGSN